MSGANRSRRWKSHVGTYCHRFAAFARLLTPVEAAALTARFDAEPERLGPPIDFGADE